jgi:hypothetical protein
MAHIIDQHVADLIIISEMIERASEFGLIFEVVYEFGKQRSCGLDTRAAARYALGEFEATSTPGD